MSVVAAKKVLKRSLKAMDERKNPADYNTQTAMLYLAAAIQEIEDKLSRLEAAAGITPPPKAVKVKADKAAEA